MQEFTDSRDYKIKELQAQITYLQQRNFELFEEIAGLQNQLSGAETKAQKEKEEALRQVEENWEAKWKKDMMSCRERVEKEKEKLVSQYETQLKDMQEREQALLKELQERSWKKSGPAYHNQKWQEKYAAFKESVNAGKKPAETMEELNMGKTGYYQFLKFMKQEQGLSGGRFS